MPEWLQVLLGVAAVLTPVVLTGMARDRSLFAAVAQVKDDAGKLITAKVSPIHDRIDRVRDEYVRRDDLNAHMGRFEKQIDELKSEGRTRQEHVDKRFDELRDLIERKRGAG